MTAIGIHTQICDSSYKNHALTALQILGASLFLALCAQIRIPLPFTPVPLTLQTCGMMLVGATLGSRKGMLAVIAYIVEGSLGAPFFAGGSCGFMKLLGPTGGYFAGWILQAYIVGFFMERQVRFSSWKTLSVLLFSSAIVLSLGVLWLASFVGVAPAFMMGCYPFIAGEIVKSLLITTYLKTQSH